MCWPAARAYLRFFASHSDLEAMSEYKFIDHTYDVVVVGGGQAGFGQTEGGAQSRASRADDDHIIGVVDEFVFAHGFKVRMRCAKSQICPRRRPAHTRIAATAEPAASFPPRARSPRPPRRFRGRSGTTRTPPAARPESRSGEMTARSSPWSNPAQ